MTDHERIEACPFCGDPMENHLGLVRHKENRPCIIGAMGIDEGNLTAWNHRSAVAPQAGDNADEPVKPLSEYRIAGQCNCGDCLRIRRQSDLASHPCTSTPVVSQNAPGFEDKRGDALELTAWEREELFHFADGGATYLGYDPAEREKWKALAEKLKASNHASPVMEGAK